MVALADERLRAGRAAHGGAVRIFVADRIVDLVPLDRAHVAAAEQMDLAVEHDRRDRAARPRDRRDRRPFVGRRVVDEALGVRAAVLFDEAAERIDLRSDRDAGNVVARMREGGLERPLLRLRVVDLMEGLIDAMLGIAGDDVDLALAFDHGVLAGRDRQPRHLHPAAGVGRLRRDASHVALLFDGLRDVGDGLVVETEKERKLFSHGPMVLQPW